MKTSEVLRAWKTILCGRRPSLSIEITRECPLRCPGCYAYGETHLGESAPTLRQLSDFKGQELVTRVLALVDDQKPLHVSIVGGDPLVRYRELEQIIPALSSRGIHVQVVTSAFRVIPSEWQKIRRLSLVVSIDGLAPEHDVRRRPATYERILKSIETHRESITVHCTITSQMMRREGYLAEFARYWSARPEIKRIWFSLYTPQRGEIANEILTRRQREDAVAQLLELARQLPKLDMHPRTIRNFLHPPASPSECTFARTTNSISADLKSAVTPCQFGGTPDCSQCGCIASMALQAVADHKVLGTLRAGAIFDASLRIGELVQLRRARIPVSADAGDDSPDVAAA